MTIRLMLADDHVLIRKGLKQLFVMMNDIQVVAEASNGKEILEKLSKVSVDLLILDVSMPRTNGENLIKEILTSYPTLPILILTMHHEVQVARCKLNAGALGYITKDSDPEMLIAAVRKVASGRRFISHELAEQLAFENNEKKPVLPHVCLSKREFQVFLKLVNGQSVNEVAADLFLSNKTVSAHKIRLMDKMGIENNSKLIQYAVTHGFVG